MTQMNDKSKPAVPVVLGIDLGKNTIHVHGVDAEGRPCVTRKLTPTRLRTWLSNLPPCRVGLEACGRAHPWGRAMEAMGHEVRLIAPPVRQAVCQVEQERPG